MPLARRRGRASTRAASDALERGDGRPVSARNLSLGVHRPLTTSVATLCWRIRGLGQAGQRRESRGRWSLASARGRRSSEETDTMKRLMILSLAVAAALPIAGCETPQQQNAANGAVLGGATGRDPRRRSDRQACRRAGRRRHRRGGRRDDRLGLDPARTRLSLRRMVLRLLRQPHLPRLVLNR